MDTTFILIRHAQAEDVIGKPDLHRALTGKGLLQVRMLRPKLASLVKKAVLGVHSTAIRSIQTMQWLTGGNNNFQYLAHLGLYSADQEQLKAIIADLHLDAQTKKIKTVLIIGHNPAFSQFAAEVSNFAVQDLGTCEGIVFKVSSSPKGESIQFKYLNSL